MKRLVTIALATTLLPVCSFAQSPGSTVGTVRGVVFTVDESAAQAVVPAATVSLDGPIHVATASDGEGKSAFNGVPPGPYTITARAPGMRIQQSVTVTGFFPDTSNGDCSRPCRLRFQFCS